MSRLPSKGQDFGNRRIITRNHARGKLIKFGSDLFDLVSSG